MALTAGDIKLLEDALKDIRSAADRMRGSIDVQKALEKIQSGFDLFKALQENNKNLLPAAWKHIKETGLDEIEGKLKAAKKNGSAEFVIRPELEALLKSADQLGTNIKDQNFGKIDANATDFLRDLGTAMQACRIQNEQDLTKIWLITSKLLEG